MSWLLDKFRKRKPMTFERLLKVGWSRVGDLERYLQEGGDVNRRTASGETLLTLAALNGRDDIVRFLLSRGADINTQGYHGYTALHHAVDFECNTQNSEDYSLPTEFSFTKLLIDSGADESLRDNDNLTARDIAVDYGSVETELYDSISRQTRSRA